MLLVLLGVFFQYKIVNCNYTEMVPNFNETHLSEQLHQSLMQVNAFLNDMKQQHITNIIQHVEKSALRTVDYESMTKQDQDFLDYTLTDMWWNESQVTGANTPQTNFLPTHKNHGSDEILTTTTTPETTTRSYYATYSPDYVPKFPYGPPSSVPLPPRFTSAFNHTYITRPSFPFSIPIELETESVAWDTYTDGPYPPGHPLYRTSSTLGPWTPTIDSLRTVSETFTEAPSVLYPSWVSLTLPPTTKKITSSGYPWPSLKPPGLTTADVQTTEVTDSPDDYPYLEETTTTIPSSVSVSGVVTTLHPNISRYVEEWLKQMNNTPKPNEDEWVTITRAPTGPTGTPQNLDNWLPNSRLDQNASHYLSPAIHRQGAEENTTLETDTEPEIPIITTEDPGVPTATAKQGEFFVEGPDGLLYLGTTPAYDENTKTTVIDGLIVYVPLETDLNKTTTIAGDVLYGNLPRITTEDPDKVSLITEMETSNMGYLMTFLIKVTELVAMKNPDHVREVIIHTEKIIVDLFNAGRLSWFGEPLVHVTMNFGMFLTESSIDEVQSYAAMAHHMLRSRKESLAVDTNSIIDYAELLYEEEEGHLLIEIITEFEDYPNITKSSFELADDLIEYVLMPYRRLANSERRRALVDSINYALSIRFPNLHRRSNHWNGPLKIKRRVQTTSQQLQTTRRRMQHKENKKIPNKQRQQKKLKKTRPHNVQPTTIYSEFNYENMLRRKYNLGGDIFPQLRRTKPVTDVQKRFSVITSAYKRFRGATARSYNNPNTLAINLDATRPTTDYKSVTSNFFLQSQIDRPRKLFYNRAPSYDNQRRTTMRDNKIEVSSFLNEVKKLFMISQAKRKAAKLKLKEKLIKRIAEGSSYSDEEASLKNNLVDALLNRRRNTKENGDEKKKLSKLDSDTLKRADSFKKNPTKNDRDKKNSKEDRQNGI